MRVFIIEYQHGAESGTKVVKCSGTTALRDKLWMLQYARIIEVEPVAAWEWRASRRKLDKVDHSKRYIIGDHQIVKKQTLRPDVLRPGSSIPERSESPRTDDH